MSLLRPLDPAFPIERQVTIDASPVVLVNVFTLDRADEQAFIKVWEDDARFMKRQVRIHFNSASPRHRRKSYLSELRCLGSPPRPFVLHFGHPEFSAKPRPIRRPRLLLPAPFSEGGGAGHLRRIASLQARSWSSKRDVALQLRISRLAYMSDTAPCAFESASRPCRS